MKIALVFTGVPRLLEASSQRIRQCLIGNHQVDVYSYVWQLDEWSQLHSMYDHTQLEIWNPSDYARFAKNRNNIFPHWYGVQRACRCFAAHCAQHNLQYDFVVRTRHDIYPHHVVDYSKLDNRLLNVSSCHWKDHACFVFDDNLTVTSQQLYLEFYDGFFDWYLLRPMHHWCDISELKLAECAVDRGFHNLINRSSMLDFELTRGVLHRAQLQEQAQL